MVAGAAAQFVPMDLRIHVGVAIDEAGADNKSRGINLLFAAFADSAYGCDFSAAHTDIRDVSGRAAAVDDLAAAYYQVIAHLSGSSMLCSFCQLACGPRRSLPGRAPVCVPLSITISPATTVARMPSVFETKR